MIWFLILLILLTWFFPPSFDKHYKIYDNNDNNDDDIILLPFMDNKEYSAPCYVGEKNCQHLNVPIYDENGLVVVVPANISSHLGYRIHYDIPVCPSTLGKLILVDTHRLKCECITNNLFDGPHCDHPTEKLTRQNGCRKVGWKRQPLAVQDITLFNPATDGVCIECASPATSVPLLGGGEPMCQTLHPKKQQQQQQREKCHYDAITGYGSDQNYFLAGYGCVCDYQNGFVEAYVPGYLPLDVISNACIKIGNDDDAPHRTDIAFHTLINGGKPLQTHVYRRLMPAFNFLLKEEEELLINQPAVALAHSHDWLNRNIPHKTTHIRRLREGDTWPVVHKSHLINKYKRVTETHPIDVVELMIGSGYETKHWYELTNQRYVSNAIWGHPIIFGTGKAFKNLATLNPLGLIERQYWGITMLTDGTMIRLDTRGGGKGKWPVVIPPRYDSDMLSESDISMYKDAPYLFFLYDTYHVS